MTHAGEATKRANIRAVDEVAALLAANKDAVDGEGTGETTTPGPDVVEEPAAGKPDDVPVPAKAAETPGGPGEEATDGERESGTPPEEDPYLINVRGPFGDDVVDLKQVSDPEVRERIRADLAKGRTYDHLLTEFDKKVEKAVQDRVAAEADTRTAAYLERVGLVQKNAQGGWDFTERWDALQAGRDPSAARIDLSSDDPLSGLDEATKGKLRVLHEASLDGDLGARLKFESAIRQLSQNGRASQTPDIAALVATEVAKHEKQRTDDGAAQHYLARVERELGLHAGTIKTSRQKASARFLVGSQMKKGVPFASALAEIKNYAEELAGPVRNPPPRPAPATGHGATPPVPPGPSAAEAKALSERAPPTPGRTRLGDSAIVDEVRRRLGT